MLVCLIPASDVAICLYAAGTKQKNAARPLMVPPAAQRPKHMIGTASSAQAGVPSPCGTGSPPGASPGPTIAQKALLFGALPVM